MLSYVCIVNESIKEYYVNKYGYEVIFVNVFYEAFYEEYAKDYV